MKYSTEVNPDKTAKAYGKELECSPKDSKNISHALRGMTVKKARTYLEDIMEKRKPLPSVYHKKGKSHQKKTGPASYPQKSARYILKTLKNAVNNAEYKGFDAENMKIKHISAYRGRVIPGMYPRAFGRATDKNKKTTNIEIILEEVE